MGREGIFLPSGLVLHSRNSLLGSPVAPKGCEQMDGRLCPSLQVQRTLRHGGSPGEPQVCFPGEQPGWNTRVRCHSPLRTGWLAGCSSGEVGSALQSSHFHLAPAVPLSVCSTFQINEESYLWERTRCSKPLLENSSSRLCCFAKSFAFQ